jgi:transcriptional regulator with XRE-family HTH domain
MASATKRFGEKLKKIRIKNNLSQLKLAEKAKLDITTINELEGGNRQPMLKTVNRIAHALNIKSSDLLDN